MTAHSMSIRTLLLALVVVNGVAAPGVWAGGKSKIARELVEAAAKKFGWKAGGETSQAMTARVGQFVSKHGDEGAGEAFRRVGPRALELTESAGEHASHCVKLLARHGDEAVWVVSRPNRLAIFVKHGDDAATAMIKHQDIVLPLINRVGQPAATALAKTSTRNARRIAMLADGPLMANPSHASGILNVVGKYGDGAASFIWRNKGSLAIASVLTAFLSDPEPFIRGVKDLEKEATDGMVSGALNYLAGLWLPLACVVLMIGGLVIILPWMRLLRWAAARCIPKVGNKPAVDSHRDVE